MTAHPGPLLSDIILSSPILTDEDGAPLAPPGQGFEFGIDPTEDPELAMVRCSRELFAHFADLLTTFWNCMGGITSGKEGVGGWVGGWVDGGGGRREGVREGRVGRESETC